MNPLELTKQLISIKSTAENPKALAEIVDFASAFFHDTPQLHQTRYESGGKPSLVVSTDDSKNPDILLMGHLDVVPAPDALYSPREENGKLLGRGTCDMKSEDAVMMQVLKDIAMQPNPPSIALMLTSDEEIGGKHGAGYLIKEIGYRTRVAFVPDGGQSPDELALWNKGILQLTITAKGQAAHGSRPWLGKNAIEQLLQACQKIIAAFPVLNDPDHWHPTANLGRIRGGTAANCVPDEASCDIDIRFTPDLSADAILERVKNACAGCEININFSEPTSHTPSGHPYVQRYADILKQHTGLSARCIKSHGGNDGRFLTSFGIPTIIARPISGAQHTPQEWLDIKSLETFHRLVHDYIIAIAKDIRLA